MTKKWELICIGVNGARNYGKTYRFFRFIILKEKHEIGCRCNHCFALESNQPIGSSGFWIPSDKKGWWTLWWVTETHKNYIRIT